MPAVPTAARGAVITGWGTALPDKIVTNADLEASASTPATSGSSSAPASASAASAARPRRWRSRPGARPSSGPGSPWSRSTPRARAPPRRTQPCPPRATTVQHALGLRCGAFDLNAACSGFVVRRWSPPHGFLAIGARTRPAHRRRDDVADRRLGRPQHRHPVRRRRRRRRPRGGRGPRPAARLGPRLRRRRAEDLLYAEVGGTDRDGRPGGLPAGRAGHGRLGGASRWSRPACTADDIAPRRAAPGEHPHHRGGLRPARHRRWTAPSVVLDRTGNTSAASIPLALADAVDDGPRRRRRPGPARRLRRRHDGGRTPIDRVGPDGV